MIDERSVPDGSTGAMPDGVTQLPVKAISRSEATRGLRWILWIRVLWGCYTPVATISGAIFTGFALWMGLGAPQIAVLVSLSSLVGLIQPLLLLVEHRIQRKRAFMIGVGFFEITLTMSVISIPLLLPAGDLRVVAAMVLVLLGATMGNMMSPFWQGWISELLPSDIRGRMISMWITVATLAAAIFGYAAGRFLDAFPVEGRYPGFLIIFLVGWVTGVGGYLLMLFIPYHGASHIRSEGFLKRATMPFRHRNFVRYLLVSFFWTFGANMSVPFLSVFMLNYLKIGFSTIALLNNLSMVLLVVGYQFWGRVADRYGSLPILRSTMVFRLLIPLLWACVSPEIASFMLPLIMIVQGITFSGLTSANSPFLYKLVSSGSEATGFFAVWSASSQLAAAVSSAIAGGIIKMMEGHVITFGGIEIGGLRLIFLLSAAVVILPNLLLRRVEEPGASTVWEMLIRKRR